MYNNGSQYNQGYTNNYNYSSYGSTGYIYDNYGQAQQSYAVSSNIQPVPPGDEYPQNSWAPVSSFNSVTSTQQTSNQQQQQPSSSSETVNNKMEGVVEEMKKQNAELIKQREEYEKRVVVLRRELDLLRKQKQELLTEGTTERDTELILKENGKLQVEIQNKLKDAFKVIEILSGVIGDGAKPSVEEDETAAQKYKERRRRSSSTDNSSNRNKYNYIHYDPELHWCRLCDVFPKTAKDLLMHLHSKEHHDAMQEENMEVPWHKLPREPEFPYFDGAPKKRLPIKGLQFFVSATAWYCRLCDTWIGDLHCASLHLKSLTHSQNYTNFVEQNPHWEIEWLKDREKAFERTNRSKGSDSDEGEVRKKKKKDKRSPSLLSSKDKKRKKKSKKRRRHSSDSSSSSTSSDSSSEDDKDDKSRSIRVAMRNKIKSSLLEDGPDAKWEVLGRLVEERKRKEAAAAAAAAAQEAAFQNEKLKEVKPLEDPLINQWMTVKEPEDNKDKYLLDSLKDRLRIKQEQEKQRLAELERKKKDKEKAEQELRERQLREAKELEETKRREEEERIKLKERDREQVRFKQRPHYRSRRSPSGSPKRSRSRSIERYEKRHSENRRRSRSIDKTEKRPPPPKPKLEEDKPQKKTPVVPTYKKLPFIGRMPLFKNKKPEEKVEKEIKKEEYDAPRQTRFQPGNLARAFIPDPEVVCFPKLSSYPPITIPPPAPAPPKISKELPSAPPPPSIKEDAKKVEIVEDHLEKVSEVADRLPDYEESMNMMYPPDQGMTQQYPYDYNMIYPHPTYDYSQDIPMESEAVPPPPPEVPSSLTMPLLPPPLPPDEDDLAMLGISSDDLAAQSF